eukprot:TRINITY_DN6481_c0_g1_i1.p1 TRINITY_DN6481_c0_g1~~TRINITY_DN6481_c0_g1_i1.p1  ORF type:complete len:167 (+),score=23.64 TRINITY_DN6481_c0_g1_i1:63-563(+)
MAARINVRPAVKEDVPAIMDLIMLLAIYEKEEDQVKMTADKLEKDGFQEPRRFHCLMCEVDGEVVGYALYFFVYSTWEGLSLYLEDLFIRKEARGQGAGMALVKAVAKAAQSNDCSRFQWQVIDWNTSALEFYTKRMGARERLETNDAKWLNMIMDKEAISKFLES